MRNFLNYKLILAGLALLIPESPTAGTTNYVCKITDFKSPGEDNEDKHWIGEIAKESMVAIDRATGLVDHPVIGNVSFRNTVLLNKGSSSWNFKVISDSGNGGHVRSYEVHEIDEGVSKGFVAISDGTAFIGSCR